MNKRIYIAALCTLCTVCATAQVNAKIESLRQFCDSIGEPMNVYYERRAWAPESFFVSKGLFVRYTLWGKSKASAQIDKKIQETIEALRDEAQTYDRWDYHEDDGDSIVCCLTLPNRVTGQKIIKDNNAKHPHITDANEYINYDYINQSIHFQYTCYLDTISGEDKPFDILALLSEIGIAIDPLVEDRRVVHWQHDESIIQPLREKRETHTTMAYGDMITDHGVTNGMIYTMRSKEQSERVIRVLRDVIENYLATHKDEPYRYYKHAEDHADEVLWTFSQIEPINSSLDSYNLHIYLYKNANIDGIEPYTKYIRILVVDGDQWEPWLWKYVDYYDNDQVKFNPKLTLTDMYIISEALDEYYEPRKYRQRMHSDGKK